MKLPSLRPWMILVGLTGLAIAALVYNAYYQKGLSELLHQSRSGAGASDSQMIGMRYPGFILKDLDGLPRNIEEWKGKPLVINFWADWCTPCRREIPALISLQGEYPDGRVQFIGVAINERDAVQKFISMTGVKFNYPVLTGVDESIEVARRYGNQSGILPYTVVVNRQGRIERVQFGEVTANDLREMLQSVI